MKAFKTGAEQAAINNIRILSADGPGPGMPIGAALMAHVSWADALHYNRPNPDWLNPDRFVLPAGHGRRLQYSFLSLNGDDVVLNDLKIFGQLRGDKGGYPQYGLPRGYCWPGGQFANAATVRQARSRS